MQRMVNVGVVRFEYKVSIVEMTTNMLTKAIPRPKHSWYMEISGLQST
jgi:hypothetical protein